jgi:acetyltransferase-like isoleucine patch superfamily enzyme
MKVRITENVHVLAGARVVDPVVHVGNLSVVADGNLPNSVARLIPARWGNATLDDWKPFIEAAKAKGIFK